jgi:two-component system response regulator (stage 0 sporulation protein F)
LAATRRVPFTILEGLIVASILVVEDNENLRELYEQELTEDGYTVLLAGSGDEAMKIVAGQKPDLIVMDVAMPGKDGIQTMHEILALRRVIPIILNTAFPHYRDKYEAWPANAYLLKSGDLTELKAKIQEMLKLFGAAQSVAG